MEIGLQSDTPVAPATPTTTPAQPAPGASAPATPEPATFDTHSTATPLHTQTQSTLAPTSEYVRYLLLALPARYVPRGIFGVLFDKSPYTEGRFAKLIANLGAWTQRRFRVANPEHAAALTYNAAMGIGSLALTASYSWTVYKDIKNIFSEAVALETGKSANEINYSDLQKSDNRIVQKTIENFRWRTFKRSITDFLFFPAAMLRSEKLGDLMVGGKALQAFTETWKRKTTMFEDLVTFINNKINPRNGLGQAISVGEVFDLYQHYAESYAPQTMFKNVLEQGTGEGAVWAKTQPIFQRITDLMNLTYAYKHSSVIDPKTGQAMQQAHFALPKLIYLLGHDLININKPAETLVTIEIANRYGIPAVKEMQTMLHAGQSLEQIAVRFPVPATPKSNEGCKPENGKPNAVIAKGSSMQIDAAPEATLPVTKIDAGSVLGTSPMASPVLACAP